MNKQESQNQVSIIINGVRDKEVEVSEKGCVCHQCDLEELCDNKLPDGVIDLCANFVGKLRYFKESDKFEV
jgi:hypothetical protein